MERTDLNSECQNLKNIIDNLMMGKEIYEIWNPDWSPEIAIDYLQEYLEKLTALNAQITKEGNTKELLEKVYDMYSELWLFQASFYMNSLVPVVRGLWQYPNMV
jgi:hypothetical protein